LNKIYLKDSLDLDFVLIAITTTLKDYVFCHKMNTSLNLDLQRIEDQELVLGAKRKISYFSRYYQLFEDTEREFFVLSNRGTESLLVDELPSVDFFILIYQFIDQEDLDELLKRLKQISEVQVAALLDVNKLKSKENLAQ